MILVSVLILKSFALPLSLFNFCQYFQVDLVWNSQWSIPKLLYIINRYAPFVDVTLNLYRKGHSKLYYHLLDQVPLRFALQKYFPRGTFSLWGSMRWLNCRITQCRCAARSTVSSPVKINYQCFEITSWSTRAQFRWFLDFPSPKVSFFRLPLNLNDWLLLSRHDSPCICPIQWL